jgi:GntR family transcriptional regulator
MMVLERQQPVPLYYQLELHLRDAIESGRFGSGEQLPPEKELSRLFGVSRVTVREALRRLEEDGLISRTPGRGTIVLPQAVEGRKIERNPARLFGFEEEIIRHGFTPRVEVLSMEQSPAPERIAALLQVSPGIELTRVRRLGWAGDEPLWVESRYFPPRTAESVTPQVASRTSVTTFLHSVVGLGIAGTRLRVSAGAASANQAKLLNIKPGDPVLINEFAFYDTARHPVEAARAVYRADRYAFTFEASSTSPSGEVALRSSGAVS